MLGKKFTALALAAALALSPTFAMAQEETGTAAGEEGLATPFGTVSPVVAGVIVVAAIVGIAIAVSSDDKNDDATGTTGTSGTSGTSGTQ